ncbi:MAG TPA: SIMPL domain-containing protein [Solirubrobacteraceae bacterium]|jgi:hypothetical protein|nr:SIMPL domain-containing protein [Solirubrobacteraceae bacterium]
MHLRIAAAAAVMSLIGAPAALADTTTSTAPTLSVNGSGSVMVTPDLATLSLSVTRSAASSRVALSEANARVDAIVAAIRGQGVPASGIQTESIDTTPSSRLVGPKGHRHRITRYTASESLSVASTTAIVGAVIDAATGAGANSIDGPSFSFSNPSAGEIAAENAALTDARQQADAAAAHLGYVVSGVQSVQLNPQSSVVAPTGTAGVSAPTAPAPTTPTTIHPGQQEVDATVAVVYTIAPA